MTGNLPFLDEVEAQAVENRNAELENRLPRRVKPRDRSGDVVGPIEFEEFEAVPFMESNLGDYFQNREIERVAAEENREITPVEQQMITDSTAGVEALYEVPAPPVVEETKTK